jgi:transposase
MSLQAQPIPPIPEATAKIARRAFRKAKGNVYMQMRDVLGTFFTDDQFTDLYPADGQPAYAPWRLALVSIMQFAENLSDRQAADAVRARIDWKYALSLDLTDEGFDFSVLSEFRDRLLEHKAAERLLDTMLEQFIQAGLLSSGGKQRTDSTHVLASVRDMNRLETAGRTLQAALDAIADFAPNWLKAWAAPEWYDRYGQLLTEFRLPQKAAERDALAVQIGWDGHALMNMIFHHPSTPAGVRQLPEVRTLRLIWIQQFVILEDELRMRERKDMPPAARLIQSPFDLEARYSCKRDKEWMGYKVHFSETCDDDAPHLITNVLTTNATQPDFNSLQEVHQALEERDLIPAEHLVDTGYTSGPLLLDSRTDYGIELVAPLVEKHPWQQATGYEIDVFTIDWKNHVAICPRGKVSDTWTFKAHRRFHELIRIKFKTVDCQPCPVRKLCTKHHRRTLSFHTEAMFKAVQQRKQEQHTDEFRKRYGKRAGIEGTISQGVFAMGMRRSRYRGERKTNLQFILTAAAMNITRALNWLNEIPTKKTQPTKFGRLAAA